MVKIIGVILSGGQGSRTSFDVPKQLVRVAGLPLIEHVIKTFENEGAIDEICIVTSSQSSEAIHRIIGNSGYKKVKKILQGGKERYHSSLAAIEAYRDEVKSTEIYFIFHDAVRPLLTSRVLKDVVEALNEYDAVDVVVPVADTVIKTDDDGVFIAAIPERNYLRLGQTPQGFHYDIINKAYQYALKDPDFTTTDDCGVVLRYLPEVKIKLIEGERSNIKLTYDEDLPLIDRLFQLRSSSSAQGDNYVFEHLDGKVIVVIGGTSGIGLEIVKQAAIAKARVHICSRTNGVDVVIPDTVLAYLEDVRKEEGRIDAIINSAGLLMKQPLMNMNEEDIVKMIGVNFTGVINVARASYKFLSETQGHLIFFSSSSYTYGREFYSLYSASKAAVVNLTQALASEWHNSGIKVNCISPERTRTPMRLQNFGQEPLKDLLDPSDVAKIVLAHLAEASSGLVIDISLRK